MCSRAPRKRSRTSENPQKAKFAQRVAPGKRSDRGSCTGGYSSSTNSSRGTPYALASFILEDGSRFYYDPSSDECFLHACECVRAGSEGGPFPEPPETIKALTSARNRAAALEATCDGGGASLGLFPYEREALLERGELLPALWIHPIEDMSE
ncbi:MAG TPA: hypothetical protein VFH16_13790 [Rubrobacter sp.]|nr:hypothetical protein [Rubrobacter sp.]